jgi:hypothetical protein
VDYPSKLIEDAVNQVAKLPGIARFNLPTRSIISAPKSGSVRVVIIFPIMKSARFAAAYDATVASYALSKIQKT